ncbi:MAG TPA: FecR domain-containing protein [Bacteroidales bacterium]|nr:FecR domain-containing protein [Bacteroidales bacterium]
MGRTENRLRDFHDLDTEQKILIRSSGYKVPDGISAEEALKLFREKLASRENDKVIIARRSRILCFTMAIAAGFLLLGGIRLLFFRSGEVTISAGTGSVKECMLSDGSKVVLNAGSFLVFRKKDFIENRNLTLSGEAFFDVVKGTPFTISAGCGKIKVHGTSFNIFARNGLFKVSCLTGSIEVSVSTESVILLPGESAELSENALVNYTEKYPERIKSWINGEFFYENTCLIDVFEEIERQFDVKIYSEGLKDKYFTGSFTNKDLKTALEIVCIPMDLDYEIGRNNKVFISQAIK